jgi:hypothetical protein
MYLDSKNNLYSFGSYPGIIKNMEIKKIIDQKFDIFSNLQIISTPHQKNSVDCGFWTMTYLLLLLYYLPDFDVNFIFFLFIFLDFFSFITILFILIRKSKKFSKTGNHLKTK